MGRCYEFGPPIRIGCEKAMVVAEGGGSCVCPSCHVSCPGRFSGCASVTSCSGYVPSTAPSWARPSTAPAVVDIRGSADLDALGDGGVGHQGLAAALPQIPSTADDLVAALESLLLAPGPAAPPPEPLTVTLEGIRAEVADLRRLLTPPHRAHPAFPRRDTPDAEAVTGDATDATVIDVTEGSRAAERE